MHPRTNMHTENSMRNFSSPDELQTFPPTCAPGAQLSGSNTCQTHFPPGIFSPPLGSNPSSHPAPSHPACNTAETPQETLGNREAAAQLDQCVCVPESQQPLKSIPMPAGLIPGCHRQMFPGPTALWGHFPGPSQSW